jgi:hypothetical protein
LALATPSSRLSATRRALNVRNARFEVRGKDRVLPNTRVEAADHRLDHRRVSSARGRQVRGASLRREILRSFLRSSSLAHRLFDGLSHRAPVQLGLRRRPAQNARRVLWLVQHQHRRPGFSRHPCVDAKPGLAVRPPSTQILFRRVDRDQRGAFCAQPIREQPQVSLPMTLPDHRRQTDEAVNRPRSARQMREMRLRPGADVIILRVGERSAAKRNDAHCHKRLIQIRPQEFEFFARLSPPASDFRRVKPAPKARQVVGRRRPEGIGGGVRIQSEDP